MINPDDTTPAVRGATAVALCRDDGEQEDEDDDRSSFFGGLLLRHRRSAGLSQRALADASGISVRALRELEHGRARAAQRRSAEMLADALGLAAAARSEFLEVARQGRRRYPPEPDAGGAVLPPLSADVVGREPELLRLRELVRTGSTVAIVGQPGVGKTALATLLARQLRHEFPDGCVAIDLRGGDEKPLPVHLVAKRLLRALGVAQSDIPVNETEQCGVYRRVVGGRRVLVLLDNAAGEAQVRPFLVAAPGCRTVVTCRRTLAGLEEVRWMYLEPLSEAGAVALLGGIAGDRTRREPAGTAELAALCGYLPLALRIAGDRLASSPNWTVGYLNAQLRDERTRLSSLSAGELQVRSVFEMSYRRLSPSGRMVFRRLAALPGAHFGLGLVQVAAEMSERDALAHLDELADAGMVTMSPDGDRFRFHDLIRLFALERWEAEEDGTERDRISEAVIRHLLGTAREAAVLCFPHARDSAVFPTLDEALDWLDQECVNWLGATREALRRGWHDEVLALSRTLHWYADDHWFDVPWEEIYRMGLEAARAVGDKAVEAHQLNMVGWTMRPQLGARALHEQALRLAAEAGNVNQRAWALAHVATACFSHGDADETRRALRESVELASSLDFWGVQVPLRSHYGKLMLRLGDVDEAFTAMRELMADVEARRTAEMTRPRHKLVALVIEGLASCLHATDDCAAAAAGFARAREICAGNGFRALEARAAVGEARCRIHSGDGVDQAAAILERALVTCEEFSMTDEHAEAEAELARLSRR